MFLQMQVSNGFILFSKLNLKSRNLLVQLQIPNNYLGPDRERVPRVVTFEAK